MTTRWLDKLIKNIWNSYKSKKNYFLFTYEDIRKKTNKQVANQKKVFQSIEILMCWDWMEVGGTPM